MHGIMTGAAVHVQEGFVLFPADRFRLGRQSFVQGHRRIRSKHFFFYFHTVGPGRTLGSLPDFLQRPLNAFRVYPPYVNPKRHLPRHYVDGTGIHIHDPYRPHSSVFFFVNGCRFHCQNHFCRTAKRVFPVAHRSRSGMIGHTGYVQFKPGGRRDVMDDTDLVTGFLQHFSLFDMHLGKAFVGTRF